MADRQYVLSVKSESTGSVRSVFVSISADGRTVRARQDSRYDEGDAIDFANGLAVNIYNVTSTARSTYNVGAIWTELAGDGVTFNVANDEEMRLDVGVLRAGQPVTRGTSVPSAATTEPVTLPGRDIAGSAEIAEDGWLRPIGNQVDDWDFSFRPLVPPADGYQPRYTSRAEVETIFRAAQDRHSGWEANFAERLIVAIETAEVGIDQYCGRRFGTPTAGTRTFRARGSSTLIVDDFTSTTITITPLDATGADQAVVNSDYYYVDGPFSNDGIYNIIRPTSGHWLAKHCRYQIAATFGFPVPAPVRNYAGKYAAEILRADAMRAGMLESQGIAQFGRQPGRDIANYLAQYRTHRGM